MIHDATTLRAQLTKVEMPSLDMPPHVPQANQQARGRLPALRWLVLDLCRIQRAGHSPIPALLSLCELLEESGANK